MQRQQYVQSRSQIVDDAGLANFEAISDVARLQQITIARFQRNNVAKTTWEALIDCGPYGCACEQGACWFGTHISRINLIPHAFYRIRNIGLSFLVDLEPTFVFARLNGVDIAVAVNSARERLAKVESAEEMPLMAVGAIHVHHEKFNAQPLWRPYARLVIAGATHDQIDKAFDPYRSLYKVIALKPIYDLAGAISVATRRLPRQRNRDGGLVQISERRQLAFDRWLLKQNHEDRLILYGLE